MNTCVQCKSQFQIADQDREFYRKIDVPEPKLCPDCRQQRRAAWRNERVLYSRICDLCKKPVISIYSPDKPYTVYCATCWWSDSWSAVEYGKEFDFTRPLFEQFKELQLRVPRIALYGKNNENSDYTNHTDHAKNCYMCVDVGFGENMLYSQWMIKCRDCADGYMQTNTELSYSSQFTTDCYDTKYSYSAEKCNEISFCYDCKDVQNCFLSSNLRHGKYIFMNKQLSKEEYEQKMKEWDLGSYATWQKAVEAYEEMVQKRALHKYGLVYYAEGSSGDILHHVKDCRFCFHMGNAEKCSYCYECFELKDSYDAYESGFNCELQYETHACNRTTHSQFTSVCYDGSFLSYCDLCHNSNNLFGCVGLKRNSHCILNKQYTPEEYERLSAKIVEHLKRTGEYGEFFPASLSPFGYNETVAPYHYPLGEQESIARGFKWQKESSGSFGKTTLAQDAIPDHIKDVGEGIVKEVLECMMCKKNYKIIAQELGFYKKINVPVPRLCSDCRYQYRLSQRNPRKLWHRQCMCDLKGHDHDEGMPGHSTGSACGRKFETTYAPDRPEIVYCEQCYQAEVI